jgi:hypothetical protein
MQARNFVGIRNCNIVHAFYTGEHDGSMIKTVKGGRKNRGPISGPGRGFTIL